MVWETSITRKPHRVLESIFDVLRQKDSERALELVKKELAICRKANIHDQSGILLIIAGRIFYTKKNLEEHNKCFETCRELFEKYPTDNASYHVAYYHWQGVRLWREERVEDALIAFLKSEKALKEIDKLSWWDECNKMYLYSHLTDMHFDYNFYEEAALYTEQALSIAEKNNDKDIISRMLIAKGNLAVRASNYNEAEQCYQCALAFKRNLNNTYGTAIALSNLGEIAFSQGAYHKTIKYLNEVLELDIDPGNAKKYWLAVKAGILNLMGDAYFELRKNDKAEDLQMAALELINQTQNNTTKKKIYQSICDLYENQGFFEKAYAYAQKILDLQANELVHTTNKRIASLRIQYEKQDKCEIVKHFNRKVEELEAANTYLGQIASSISHDVRAPLRNVVSYLGLLKHKHAEKLNNEGLEFLNIAVEAAKDAEILTKSLSDLGKLETDHRAFDEVDIGNITGRVCRNLEYEIRQKNVKFDISTLPAIMANEGQMLQLFQNLISNAVKYNQSEQPLVTIAYEQNAAGQHEFSVKDNGIGIALEYHEQVFEIFRRLHGNAEYKGTGIGLAICSLIVKKHGGDIWVESQPGEGATFKFTLNVV